MEQTTFEGYFRARNPQHAFLLSRMQCAMDVKEVTFDDINTTNLRKFKDYLLDTDNSNSTVKQYMSVIMATCKVLASDGLVRPVNAELVGRIRADKTQNIALTEEEVKLFVDYYKRLYTQPKHQCTKDVLTLFLIELFTGARSCDCETFSRKDIEDGILSYVSQKTHTLTHVPVHTMLPMLLSRIPKKDYSRMTKNRVIKRTAEKLGITQNERRNYHGVLKSRPRYEYLGTHSARRTFISTMLDRNVPIAKVSKMAGHASPEQTLRYYCSDKLNLCEEAMSFFNA